MGYNYSLLNILIDLYNIHIKNLIILKIKNIFKLLLYLYRIKEEKHNLKKDVHIENATAYIFNHY